MTCQTSFESPTVPGGEFCRFALPHPPCDERISEEDKLGNAINRMFKQGEVKIDLDGLYTFDPTKADNGCQVSGMGAAFEDSSNKMEAYRQLKGINCQGSGSHKYLEKYALMLKLLFSNMLKERGKAYDKIFDLPEEIIRIS